MKATEDSKPDSKAQKDAAPKSRVRSASLLGVLAALGCETLFGLSYLFTKSATNAHATELALLAWRFIFAAAFMLLLVALRVIRLELRGKRLGPLLLISLFSPVAYFVGETFGISHTTASETGIILGACPVVTLIAAALILRIKPKLRELFGIFIAVAGVVVATVAKGIEASFNVFGYAMLALAAVSYALYVVYVVRARAFSAWEKTFVLDLVGVLTFVTLAVVEAVSLGAAGRGEIGGSGTPVTNLVTLFALPFNHPGFTVAAAYQGVGCSVVAYFLSIVAIAKIGANRTASFVGFATVVSVVAAVIFLGESITWLQVFGAVVIVAGVYIANINRERGKNPSA